MNVTRVSVASGIAAFALLLLAGPASAHVTVQPQGEAAKGGSAVIHFKVPNERDNASTTKFEVTIPADHPLASVMPEPIPGWKIEVTKTKLAKPLDLHGSPVTEAVSKVTWTADGSKVPPGQFQLFPLSVSPLPENTDQLVFKALQTYDDKEVVRWIDEPSKDGAEEPENPAPVLQLTAPAAEDGHGATAETTAEITAKKDDASAPRTTAASSDSTDSIARVLGIVGIVVGIAGVAFGALTGRRRSA